MAATLQQKASNVARPLEQALARAQGKQKFLLTKDQMQELVDFFRELDDQLENTVKLDDVEIV